MNKRLTILAVVLLASCSPYNKIASDTKRTDAEQKLLATICAQEFPPEVYVTPGTTTIDSSEWKANLSSLQFQLDNAYNTINSMEKAINESDITLADKDDVLKDVKKAADSLRYVLNTLKRGVPCPDRHTRDTGMQVSRAELDGCRLDNKGLEKKIAVKDVRIEELEAENAVLSKKPDRYWAGFKHGAMAAAGVLIVVFGYFKVKSII